MLNFTYCSRKCSLMPCLWLTCLSFLIEHVVVYNIRYCRTEDTSGIYKNEIVISNSNLIYIHVKKIYYIIINLYFMHALDRLGDYPSFFFLSI